jgi:WD40 repeat protein
VEIWDLSGLPTAGAKPIELNDVASERLQHVVLLPFGREEIASGPIPLVVFSPDGRWLAVGDGSGISLVDLQSLTAVASLDGADPVVPHGSPEMELAISPDGVLVAATFVQARRWTIAEVIERPD